MRKAISFTLILCLILTPLASVQAMELEIPIVEKVDELPKVVEAPETPEMPMEEEIDNSLVISDEVVKDVLNEEIGVTENQEIVESDTTSEENKNVDLEELEDKTQEDFLVEKQEQDGKPEQSDDEIEVIPLFEDEIVEEIEIAEELEQPVDEIVVDNIENTPDENIEQLEDELPEIPDSMVDDVVDEEIVENIEDLELVDEELVEETKFSEELGEVGVVENQIEGVVEQPIEQIPMEQQLQPVEQLPSEISLITESLPAPPKPEIYMPLKTTIISNNYNYLSIENITEAKLVVTEIIIEGQNGWKQVSYNDNFKDKKIGTKEFGVRLNNLSLSDSYTAIERKGTWFIEPYETADYEIEIITAGQVKQITEEIFTIKVMVDLAEYHIQTIATETINNIIAIEQSIIENMVHKEVKLEEIETPEELTETEEQIKQDEEVENDELVITEETIETEEIKQDDIVSHEEELKTEDVILDEIEETENVEEIKDIIEEDKDVGMLERVETPEENESLEEIIKSEDTPDTNISEEVENTTAPDEETEYLINK